MDQRFHPGIRRPLGVAMPLYPSSRSVHRGPRRTGGFVIPTICARRRGAHHSTSLKAICPSRPPLGRFAASRASTARRTQRQPLRQRWGDSVFKTAAASHLCQAPSPPNFPTTPSKSQYRQEWARRLADGQDRAPVHLLVSSRKGIQCRCPQLGSRNLSAGNRRPGVSDHEKATNPSRPSAN
jgi:hypothetical protein